MRSFLALALVAVGVFPGCVAYHVPSVPPPSAAVQTRQLTLGIERSQCKTSLQHPNATPFTSEQALIEALRRRNIFKQVDFVDRLSSPPDIVLKETFLGTFRYDYQPLPLFLTAGIVPMVCKTPYLLELKLADGKGSRTTTLNYKEDDPYVIGWAALPMKLNSHWSSQRINTPVVMDLFAAEIEKAVSESISAQH